MKNLAYYNGKFGTCDEVYIPFNDRSHFFGDGVYDVTYARNHNIYAIEEHMDRFFNSAALLDINIPHSKEEMSDILNQMVKKVDSGDQFVYWQVTRGTQDRGHVYPEKMPGNIWIYLKPLPVMDTYKTVTAITAPDTRFYHCNIKTLNLIPSVMYSQNAQKAGVYETILYREGGRVTECAHSNVHIINKDGVFQTAPADNLILPGIARAHLIRACHALGYKVSETPFTVDDLMEANEVIISSSGSFCLRCTEVDGKTVGGKSPEMIKYLQDYLVNDFITSTN